MAIGLGLAFYLLVPPFVIRLLPIVGPLSEPLFRQRLPRAHGPESPELKDELQGCLVYEVNDQPGERIALRVVPLGEGAARTESWPIRGGYVHSLAGPDYDGHVAIGEDRLFSSPKSHALKILSLADHSVKVLFERPGTALWDHMIGEHIGMPPRGELVAMVTGLRGVQMRSPDAYLQEGTLEIWDIKTQQRIQTLDGVADDSMSWLPDGRGLAFTKFVSRGQLPAGSDPADFGKWDRIPVVFIWNLREASPIAVGWHPAVSSDGRRILLSRFDEKTKLVEVATGHETPVDWPARWGGEVLGLVGPAVIYRGLLTEGAKPAWAETGSPLVNRWQLLPIKAAEVESGRFVTLTEAFDPRREASYGLGSCMYSAEGRE